MTGDRSSRETSNEKIGIVSRAPQTYAGWDRFGRVVEQTWTVDGTAVDSYSYTYDRNSNRLTRTNEMKTDGSLDETYTYDGLDRLAATTRGGSAYQGWGLDSLGNWDEFTDQGDDQTREHDAANQIASISGTWIDPTYDAAGNMITGPKPGAETTEIKMVYDAWNRMVKVTDASDVLIAEYQYDGQNRRVAKIVRQVDGETVTYDRTDYEYNEAWQALEERTATYTSLTGTGGARTTVAETVSVQYLPDIRYIDAMVLRWRYDGETTEVQYLCQDANYNTTALIADSTGLAVERTSYAAYGPPTFYGGDWSTRTESQFASEILYASYRYDPETGLNLARFRYDHPTLGRFMSTDPSGYQAGLNLYDYSLGQPTTSVDPYGLFPMMPGPPPMSALGTPFGSVPLSPMRLTDAAASLPRQPQSKDTGPLLDFSSDCLGGDITIRRWFSQYSNATYEVYGTTSVREPGYKQTKDRKLTVATIMKPQWQYLGDMVTAMMGGDTGRGPDYRRYDDPYEKSPPIPLTDAAKTQGPGTMSLDTIQSKSINMNASRSSARGAASNGGIQILNAGERMANQTKTDPYRARFVGQCSDGVATWYLELDAGNFNSIYWKTDYATAAQKLKEWCGIDVP